VYLPLLAFILGTLGDLKYLYGVISANDFIQFQTNRIVKGELKQLQHSSLMLFLEFTLYLENHGLC
jgi:hypothetical protein